MRSDKKPLPPEEGNPLNLISDEKFTSARMYCVVLEIQLILSHSNNIVFNTAG